MQPLELTGIVIVRPEREIAGCSKDIGRTEDLGSYARDIDKGAWREVLRPIYPAINKSFYLECQPRMT
jgi:hypothetical protein